MQLRGPAPDMVHLRSAQRYRGSRAECLQAGQRLAVQRQRARRQPTLDLQVLEVAEDVGVDIVARRIVLHGRDDAVPPAQAAAGSSRVNAAPATSPMRPRNSVPMSAV